MNITITSQNKNEYLLVSSKGKLITKEDLFRHAEMVYEEIAKYDKQKILVEAIDTQFPMSLFSYSHLVEHYIHNLPSEIKFLKLAIVISEEYKDVAEFWETVCNNKGFQYSAFLNFQDAYKWLNG